LVMFTAADAQNGQIVFTAPATAGGTLNQSSIVSSDTVANTLVFTINNGITQFIVGEVAIPAGAGTDGSTPSVTFHNPVAMPGLFQADGSMVMQPDEELFINMKATITTGFVGVTMKGGPL